MLYSILADLSCHFLNREDYLNPIFIKERRIIGNHIYTHTHKVCGYPYELPSKQIHHEFTHSLQKTCRGVWFCNTDDLLGSWVRIHSQNCHCLFVWFHIVNPLTCCAENLSLVAVYGIYHFPMWSCIHSVAPPISHSREKHGLINLLVLICILQILLCSCGNCQLMNTLNPQHCDSQLSCTNRRTY